MDDTLSTKAKLETLDHDSTTLFDKLLAIGCIVNIGEFVKEVDEEGQFVGGMNSFVAAFRGYLANMENSASDYAFGAKKSTIGTVVVVSMRARAVLSFDKIRRDLENYNQCCRCQELEDKFKPHWYALSTTLKCELHFGCHKGLRDMGYAMPQPEDKESAFRRSTANASILNLVEDETFLKAYFREQCISPWNELHRSPGSLNSMIELPRDSEQDLKYTVGEAKSLNYQVIPWKDDFNLNFFGRHSLHPTRIAEGPGKAYLYHDPLLEMRCIPKSVLGDKDTESFSKEAENPGTTPTLWKPNWSPSAPFKEACSDLKALPLPKPVAEPCPKKKFTDYTSYFVPGYGISRQVILSHYSTLVSCGPGNRDPSDAIHSPFQRVRQLMWGRHWPFAASSILLSRVPVTNAAPIGIKGTLTSADELHSLANWPYLFLVPTIYGPAHFIAQRQTPTTVFGTFSSVFSLGWWAIRGDSNVPTGLMAATLLLWVAFSAQTARHATNELAIPSSAFLAVVVLAFLAHLGIVQAVSNEATGQRDLLTLGLPMISLSLCVTVGVAKGLMGLRKE